MVKSYIGVEITEERSFLKGMPLVKPGINLTFDDSI